MNRAEKRAQLKARKKMNNSVEYHHWNTTSIPIEPKIEEPKVPGINCRPVDLAFDEMVVGNRWHNSPEFSEVIETIKGLLTDLSWSWARNHNCKYVDIRIDMRDGGFIVMDRTGERINMEQLKWQYKSVETK